MQINRRETEPTLGGVAKAAKPDTASRPQAPATGPMATDQLVKGARVAETAAKVVAASSAAQPAGLLGGLKRFASNLWGKTVSVFKSAKDFVVDKVWNPALKWAMWGVMDADKEPLTYKTIDNPSDVNHPRPGELTEAQAAVKQHAAEEQAAIAKLPPEARKQYEALTAQMVNRPMSRRALQAMLLDGRLPGEKDLQGGGTLLANLHGMLTAPMDTKIDRAELIGELISEVENPVRIAQHSMNTCGATTMQIMVARKAPAEYVRLITGLASPNGEVQMKGGDTLNRHDDWDAKDGGRSISSRLIQAPLMENGPLERIMSYDNSDDKHRLLFIRWQGLSGWGGADLMDQLLGKNYDGVTLFRWNRQEKWNAIKQLLKDGQGPIPVGTTWGENGSGHFIQIDKVENGKVTFTNPWGEVCEADEAHFLRHVTQVVLPTGKNYKGGGGVLDWFKKLLP